MELHLLSMPKTSESKLMVEFFALEVDAAKILEEPSVEILLSFMELQFIELHLEVQRVFHFVFLLIGWYMTIITNLEKKLTRKAL